MFLLQRGNTALMHPYLLGEPFFLSSSMKLDLSSLAISLTFNILLLMFCLGGGFYFDHNLVSLREGPFTRLVGRLALIDFSKQFPLDFHNGSNIKVIC